MRRFYRSVEIIAVRRISCFISRHGSLKWHPSAVRGAGHFVQHHTESAKAHEAANLHVLPAQQLLPESQKVRLMSAPSHSILWSRQKVC